MAIRQCDVCCEAQSKYKCPTCLVPYCSLGCFRKHKETPCENTEKPLPSVEAVPAEQVILRRSLQVEEASWILNQEKLQCIVESGEVRDSLKDSYLRTLIQRIDSSENPEDELEEFMKGQIFHDFTDKILSIVSPED